MKGWRQQWLAVLICALVLAWAGGAAAQIEQARAAYEKEDYAAAYKLYKPEADKGLAEAQYRMGLMHKFG